MADKNRFNSIEIRVNDENYTDVFIDKTEIRGLTELEFECRAGDKPGDKPRMKLTLTIKR